MDAELLEQLHDPAIYPRDVSEVEVVQTHLSVVCLAGRSAYKLKKPVRLPFVDFSTLEKRRHFCEEEVRLNRRLCPGIYRGVRPLYRSACGRISFREDEETDCEIIDFAVEMERLPENRMMNRLLAQDAVSPELVSEIAERMARFHGKAERSVAVNLAGDPARLRDFALENFEETSAVAGATFDPELHGLLQQQTGRDFEWLLPVLRRRSEEGRIIDGHGDLHTRNICLCDPVAIYDCIEFNPNFRCGDSATENAFLVMDLGYRGHPELAEAYLDAYIRECGDEEQRDLMPPLVRYRMMVRAKVSAIAAGESEMSEEEHREALHSARRHFHRVAASIIEENEPCMVISCGLPGTGKSHLFTALAVQTGWGCFSSDSIRKQLAGAPMESPLPDSRYTSEFSVRTYREMLNRAAGELARRRIVLVDANFRGGKERAWAREVAEAAGARVTIVFFETPESVILNRLEARESESNADSDAGVSIYRQLQSEFEPPAASECDRLIRVAGDLPTEVSVPKILAELIRY